MAIIRFSTPIRTAMAQQVADKINAGSGAGKILFYTGTMPADADTAITSQVLLGTLVCSDPCASVTTPTITFGAITQDDAADASGTATWCRIVDSDDGKCVDLDVTAAAGTGAVKLNTTTIVAGGPIRMNSLTVTIG